ncbi:MAG: DNA cytosine methyltransferase [Erythrobacter sp.]
MAERKRLASVSLFSGAGGMDIGMREAGFDILLANDIDPDACETYRLNHGERIVEAPLGDILPIFRQVKGIDLLFGGPPCQGFSVAGRMDPDDPRSALMSAFFDAVDYIKPAAFVCENVKALAALGRWEGIRNDIMSRVDANYHAKLIVLRASDFGVPQNRERMFIVGVRREKLGCDNFDLGALLSDLLDDYRETPKSVGQIIRGLGPAGSQGNPRVCSAKITFAKAPVMRKSPFAGMLFNGAGRPFASDGPAPTLPASMGGNKTPIVDEREIFDGDSSYVAEYHKALMQGARPNVGTAPDRLRRLTVDECLAIQSFPADYQLHGARSAMYRQIGNAVPCRLAYAVGSVVKSILEERMMRQTSKDTPFIPKGLRMMMTDKLLEELQVA